VTIPPVPPRKEPNLFWLLAISLALHAVVFILFSGILTGSSRIERRPVYYVDLSKMPVLNPRAGRPDGGPAKPVSKPAAKPKPVTPEPAPAPKPAKDDRPQTQPAAEKPAVTKPATATAKTGTRPAREKNEPAQTSASSGTSYQSVQDKLAAMRENQQRQQELADLKNKIAALSGGEGYGSGAPLGMPDGTGDEIGVDQQTWLQAYLKESWSLSKYQVTRRDLSAIVHLSFAADGTLTGYRFVESSGDATFDDSVKKAILKAKTLPFKPGRAFQMDAVFNLKDLME
jgi:colicin import membrane protein